MICLYFDSSIYSYKSVRNELLEFVLLNCYCLVINFFV